MSESLRTRPIAERLVSRCSRFFLPKISELGWRGGEGWEFPAQYPHVGQLAFARHQYVQNSRKKAFSYHEIFQLLPDFCSPFPRATRDSLTFPHTVRRRVRIRDSRMLIAFEIFIKLKGQLCYESVIESRWCELRLSARNTKVEWRRRPERGCN